MLSCNIQAGSSTQRYRDYVSRSWSHVLPHGKRDNLAAIAELCSDFDVVGLQESDAGSLRSGFTNQTHRIAELAGFPFWSHQSNRRVGGITHSANGLLARERPTEILDYSLPGRVAGRGVLLARFGDAGTGKPDHQLTVAIAHLSLGAQSRSAQLDFLAELLGDALHVVLMGDFNCAHDTPDMQRLYRRTRLQPPSTIAATFPSWKPVRALDHILCSEGLAAGPPRALTAGRSDHLAIALELSLPEATAL
ncbi:MAG TPA: endonuclease/exonuclease/phosphatase family protein [Xanthomonadaceae bacterium]|nr:endonuclease/exonuclease/phosphatase family protein [Xanthomonadaceae bacterium]